MENNKNQDVVENLDLTDPKIINEPSSNKINNELNDGEADKGKEISI